MEEEKHKEELKAEEQDIITCHPSLLPRKPYTWLMISDTVNADERHIFYNTLNDCYYVRFVPELQNKYVACSYGGWLVLRDRSTYDCSILNILTMKKFQLPPLHIPQPHKLRSHTHCVMSSSKMDRSCRVIFFDIDSYREGVQKFSSCHIGDSEFIEGELTRQDGRIRDFINFKGRLYAVTSPNFSLFASDFSDSRLRHEQVISGQSLDDLASGLEEHVHLVESIDDLLLFIMSQYDFEFSDVKILKADFSIGKWVKVETLGDRAVFLGSVNNSFSSPASSCGMKGNVVYWVRDFTDWIWSSTDRHLYMYDMEDKSISMSLPVPIVENCSSLSWVSFPMTCNEEKLERKYMSYLFEASPIETNFHVQLRKATIESTELQIEQRKAQKREERETISKTTLFRKKSSWEDLPNDLLLEISPYLFAGDKVAFRSVCRSWYSVFPSYRSSQQFVLPMKRLDCSSPFLMCPDNKMCHPIYDELYSNDFPDIPGANIRAVRDGWLLMVMDNCYSELFFYNPLTKAKITLPDCDAWFYHSVFFSVPPTSSECLVVIAATKLDNTHAICFMKIGDQVWTCHEVPEDEELDYYYFSNCNVVPFKDKYYFLGDGAKLLIFCPKEVEFRVIEAPKFVCNSKFVSGQQYMLESDGKLIAVFLSNGGSSVYTCEWNEFTSEWEILESLGNKMLFVSRPLSLCKRATVRGTGNKIYFPRVVGDGHILFYSLATKRYHTFEMGSSYSNFFDSKYYPRLNGWFMP